MQTGLLSVTFRALSAREIVDLAVRGGVQAIEWGGDIHVPHGNQAAAAEVGRITREEGLQVAAYGSYYRVGCENNGVGTFEQVLDTAAALGAPAVRVWAGDRGSAEADDAWWSRVTEDAIRIGGLAAQAGMRVDFEYHGNTLTDTAESAVRLMKSVGQPNVRSYWQMPLGLDKEEQLRSLEVIQPWLANVHVYHWEGKERQPLANGINHWIPFVRMIHDTNPDDFMMLEFVKGDAPEQFLQDAEALKRMLASL